MKGTYKAVEVPAPGVLRVVARQVSEPGAGQVRIRVEACGICHTDAATITGVYPGLILPRVPGHEVVGRIEALGSGVSRWKIGQRVGVGFFGGEDGVCEPRSKCADQLKLSFRIEARKERKYMNDLAKFAMDAHGGLDRWRQLRTVSAHLLQCAVRFLVCY